MDDTLQSAVHALDLCITIMMKDILSPARLIRIGDELKQKSELAETYQKIDRYIMLTLIEKVAERVPTIKKLELYLHKSLLCAQDDHEGEAYYVRLEAEERERKENQGYYR